LLTAKSSSPKFIKITQTSPLYPLSITHAKTSIPCL
jgi:hypothetical protein